MKRRYLRIVIAGVIFLLALLLTLYPVISNLYNQEHQSQIQTAYREVLEQTDTSELERMRQRAIAYNRAITPGTAEEAYSQEAIQMASEDYVNQLDLSGTGIMGYVEIPTISVDLPIYHGTGSDSLDRGTGHLLGSSLPVGGESTHTIITGHSGMASQKMFTDLEQLQEGDVFYLHVLDEVLAYQVDAIHTVLPHDTTYLGIVPGQDLCTLVTCTPTGVNTHRLLVRGTRISYEPSIEAQNAEPEHEVVTSSHWEDQYWFGIRLGVVAMVSIVLLVNVGLFIRKNGESPHGEKEAAMSESKGKIFFSILAVLLLLSGSIILLYPSLNGLWVDYTMRQNAREFLSYVEVKPFTPAEGIPNETISQEGVEEADPPTEHTQLWLDMKAYNEAIFREGQEGLSNPTAYEESSFCLMDYGLESEVFGVLSIPRLSLEMPIYLGASKQNMANGAAVMGQTSLPIGGSNTNCVLAGHRGWNGAAYFLYINQLEPGDIVTITNLWETLTYKVVETEIISPNDVEAIHIQPNRELLTLLTCHPPASGGKQRYLVVCERTYL